MYFVVRGSVRKDGYVEKCKCGKSVVTSITRRELGKKVEVAMVKHWFDREGNVTRTTGNGDYLPCIVTKSIDNE